MNTRPRAPTLPSALLAAVAVASLAAGCGDESAGVALYDPTPAEAGLSEVMARLRAGEPRKALEAWDTQAATTGVPEGALHYRAMAQADAGDVDGALATWEEELSIHPGNARAMVFVADAEMGRGRLDAAAERLERAARLDDEFPMLHLVTGRLALLRDEDETAARAFRDLLETDPWGPHAAEAYHALFQIAVRRGDPMAALHEQASAFLEQFHSALAYSRSVLVEHPEDVTERLRVGVAYLSLYERAGRSPIFGQPQPRRLRELLDNSEAAFRGVLDVDPDHAKALHYIGNIRRFENDLQEAARYFRLATEADPTFTEAHNNLALALHLLNDRVGAHSVLLAAFEHGTDRRQLAVTLIRLADLEADQGDLRSALDRLELYLEWFPEDPLAARERAETLKRRLAEEAADAGGGIEGAGEAGGGAADGDR